MLTAQPSNNVDRQFFGMYEKMVLLDYAIRNTDRGADNWLVRVDEPAAHDLDCMRHS